MTNINKIRSMSLDEMARWLASVMQCFGCPKESDCSFECAARLREWLEEEAEGGAEND